VPRFVIPLAGLKRIHEVTLGCGLFHEARLSLLGLIPVALASFVWVLTEVPGRFTLGPFCYFRKFRFEG
jgi:hypothetical protein